MRDVRDDSVELVDDEGQAQLVGVHQSHHLHVIARLVHSQSFWPQNKQSHQ